MIIFDSVSAFCLNYGLNPTDQPRGNDDSCHDIKEFIVYGYDEFEVNGFVFTKEDIDVPRPIAKLGSYKVYYK